MSQLAYAILGLLNRKSLSGYDISSLFDEKMNNVWYAKHSQIYTELKKMTAEGLLEYETIIQGEKLKKKLYSITEKGRAAFNEWLRREGELEPTPKDEFRVRVFFAESLTSKEREKLYASQLSKKQKRLKWLEEKIQKQLEKPETSDTATPEFWDYLLMLGCFKRESAYVSWIRESLELFEETTEKNTE